VVLDNLSTHAIRDYIAFWNTQPRPFQWTATTDEVLAKVRLTQLNVKKLVGDCAASGVSGPTRRAEVRRDGCCE
jgi:hypothetical protein